MLLMHSMGGSPDLLSTVAKEYGFGSRRRRQAGQLAAQQAGQQAWQQAGQQMGHQASRLGEDLPPVADQAMQQMPRHLVLRERQLRRKKRFIFGFSESWVIL